MAYGTPSTEDDVEAYLTHIRQGRRPKPEEVEDLKRRYRAIGGSSPLLDIMTRQASALEEALNSDGVKPRIYIGMKHWHPFIEEVVPKILGDGFRRIIALALAPHYSNLSIGGYKRAVENAQRASRIEIQVDFIESWYDHPSFHLAVAEKVRETLKQFPTGSRESPEVIFTAHSLPERILQQNDPYPNQLRSSCQAVADLVGIGKWSFAYQSAGHTPEKWLGPDIQEVLKDLSERPAALSRNVLIVPIGFVSDHLEILYDLDIEAQLYARNCGLTLKRTESLNTSQTFISALMYIVRERALAFHFPPSLLSRFKFAWAHR